ncbi:MAG: hypothetical protein LBH00_10650 [Planctomycetaceae bacterium]|nr:hypothetical protein [Planctomycetaceae bacterium]
MFSPFVLPQGQLVVFDFFRTSMPDKKYYVSSGGLYVRKTIIFATSSL